MSEAEPLAPALTPTYIGAKARTKTVPLEYPFEVGGKTYTEIVVHRMTAGQIATLIEMQESGVKQPRFPMFGDVPPEVLDMLDADDDFVVNQVVMDFLPRQFRTAEPTPEPTPVTGAASSPELPTV